MKTYTLAHNLELVDVAPPIPGFEKFLGVYVLRAKKVALIDVGPSISVGNLISALGELNINPADISYILVTHIHIDHAGGIGKAIKQMPNAMVMVHERSKPHLVDPSKLWEGSQQALGELALEYGPIEPVTQDRILTVEDGTTVNLDGMEIQVLSTPGHSPDHLSFLDKNEGRIFVGEAAGVYVEEVDLVRPATPSPFNLEQALTSLDRLIRLAPPSLCYAHFGWATQALEKLNYYKQKLLSWGGLIVDCLEKEANWQDVYNEIRQKDEALARINRLPPDQRRRELYFIENGIKGFIGYFRKYGTEYIKSIKGRRLYD